MRKVFVALAAPLLLGLSASAKDPQSNQPAKRASIGREPATAICTFADGKQLSVRYQASTLKQHEDLPLRKPWPDDRSSMFLFTPVGLAIGDAAIPAGAYSLYVTPGHDDWTLAVNKNVAEDAKYDQTLDLVRTPMKIGEVSRPADRVSIYFAHVAPRQCNMRLYVGKTGVWAEFKEE